jgi:hypothetical protein
LCADPVPDLLPVADARSERGRTVVRGTNASGLRAGRGPLPDAVRVALGKPIAVSRADRRADRRTDAGAHAGADAGTHAGADPHADP